MTCCFTGHREIPAAEAEKINEQLFYHIEKLIRENGVTHFIAGGAIGFDTMAANAVLEFKKKYDVTLEIAVPCKDQELKWSKEQKAEYKRILESADSVTGPDTAYHRGVMHVRNRYMVEKSEFVISYCHSTSGGTYYTVSYARKLNKTVINL